MGIKAGGKQKLLLFFAKFANNSSVCQETSNKIEQPIPFDSCLPPSGYSAGGSAFGYFLTSFLEQNVRAFIEIRGFPKGQPPAGSNVVSGLPGILRFPGITAKKTSTLPEFIAYLGLHVLESLPLTVLLSRSLAVAVRLSIAHSFDQQHALIPMIFSVQGFDTHDVLNLSNITPKTFLP